MSLKTRDAVLDDLVDLLRRHAEALPSPEADEKFGAFFGRFGDARLVLLGEATHGTAEFYQARAAITRHLIEHCGFNIVAVEADWPDAAHLDDYVRHGAPRPGRSEAFTRFPAWMWRNREFMAFADWLRAHNAGLAMDQRVEIRGLDVYSLSESITAVLHYLDIVDPDTADLARRRYGCLTPWQSEPALYGRAVLHGRESCEDAVVEQLQDLLTKRLDYLGRDGDAFFDAMQNARIIRAAEGYYRAMYRGATESWNLRDRHMFDTLDALFAHRGHHAKAIVWAHNSHIGNAGATSMGWQGEFNIGQLCRDAWHDDCVLVGFGTDRGTVAAASDWGGPMQVKTVLPARPDSIEHLFRRAGVSRCLVDWRSSSKAALREALQVDLLERAIGVVYRPETEFLSHYFEAIPADQFDAYVWFEDTHAVTPLPVDRPHGAPDTWPFGV